MVIPCADQTVACNREPARTPSSPAASTSSLKDNKSKSDKPAVGILAQVEQDNLLVIRSKPRTGDVVGRAGPLSMVNIVDGPSRAGGAIWFKVNIAMANLSGWATENNLYACSKEDGCN